jgi:two-component system, chemotaxis family, response regulator Rcp1
MPIEVLLVEDNADDARLTQEAFREAINVHWNVVSDGVEAMNFLNKDGAYLLAPTPNLILLDLKLPKMHGGEVLAHIKKNERLREIPVIVLTASKEYGDMIKSYKLHANCYVNKPYEFGQFENIAKSICDLWLN